MRCSQTNLDDIFHSGYGRRKWPNGHTGYSVSNVPTIAGKKDILPKIGVGSKVDGVENR